MTDVNQNSNVYQLMTPEPEIPLVEETIEEVMVYEPMVEEPTVEEPHMLILP